MLHISLGISASEMNAKFENIIIIGFHIETLIELLHDDSEARFVNQVCARCAMFTPLPFRNPVSMV